MRMLVHLSVRDFALIDALELSLAPGLTAVTGETGAGKSILVGALSLLLGGRSRADLIRTGADEAEVAGQFALSGPPLAEAARALEELGLPPCEDGELLIRRTIGRAGRHRQFVNGSMVTVRQLKAVTEPLVDITGQHAHQALVRPGAQRELLDAFGAHEAARERVAELWRRARDLAEERAALSASEADKLQRAEYLRYQLDEIHALAPEPGEEESLASERARLMNAERLGESVSRARQLLVDGDDALSRVQEAARALSAVSQHDAELAAHTGTLEEAAALIDDVGRTLSRHAFAEDPARLAEVDDRLDALRGLERKHGGSLAAVLEAAERMDVELRSIETSEERLQIVEREHAQTVRELAAACDTLAGKRRAAARRLARRAQEELADLGMAAARLEIRVEPLPATADAAVVDGAGGRTLAEHGGDRVEILLSANPGEPVSPIDKVASGGELSRVLLALQRTRISQEPVPLSVFDEVDAGVGGAVGQAIGEKLRAIAEEGRQVLCVTHLGPIAAQAHEQIVVEKHAEGGRTHTRVRTIAGDERVDEIARMIGGRELTATTREHAEEMLKLTAAVKRRKAAARANGAKKAAKKAAAKPAKKPAKKPAPKQAKAKKTRKTARVASRA
jgi:DNA repair protein RecN (Recombination protein N)